MEIRTDFTALVLPTAAELELAAERARIVAETADDVPPRILRRPFGIGRRSGRAVARHAVAH